MKVIVKIPCTICKEDKFFTVEDRELKEFQSNNRRHIQDIFPELLAEEREMFMTGICPDCWANLFNDEDENKE